MKRTVDLVVIGGSAGAIDVLQRNPRTVGRPRFDFGDRRDSDGAVSDDGKRCEPHVPDVKGCRSCRWRRRCRLAHRFRFDA